MGANDHKTVRPENRAMAQKRETLLTRLRSLDAVTRAHPGEFGGNTVVFYSDGPCRGDMTSGVLQTLADSNAMLPAQQPDNARKHVALIELD